MNISIFGLGYVGCIGAGCLSDSGHNVIGVDINKNKVKLLNNGKATIVEKKIDEIVRKNFNNNRIKATTDSEKAVHNSEIAIICVGTPNNENGNLNMDYIYKVSKQIGIALKDKDSFFTVAIRSTVIPGTNREVGNIIESVSNKKINKDFGVVSNPEFLREGSAIDDFYNPPYTILASDCIKSLEIMEEVYVKVNGEFLRTEIGSAELIKLVNNSFHALKVSFANEIGRICKKLNLNSHQLMDLFVKDKVLNISPYYFKPGFAYGGSCLPKDLRALKTLSHDFYLTCSVIESIEESNNYQKQIAIELIESQNKKNIGILGLSFKAGTDDIRYSPIVDVAEYFLGKGYILRIFDESIKISKLTGTNKDYINSSIPHLSSLMMDEIDEVVKESEVIVITHNLSGIVDLIKKYPHKIFIDLIKVTEEPFSNYQGIGW